MSSAEKLAELDRAVGGGPRRKGGRSTLEGLSKLLISIAAIIRLHRATRGGVNQSQLVPDPGLIPEPCRYRTVARYMLERPPLPPFLQKFPRGDPVRLVLAELGL